MATVTTTTTALVDDLDEAATADSTVEFSVEGHRYEIDLTGANREKLYNALEPFMVNGRRIREAGGNGRARRRRPTPVDPAQTAAVREWARANGHTVSDRGRVSRAVQRAFDQAHQGGQS
jgi:hypothetical protein